MARKKQEAEETNDTPLIDPLKGAKRLMGGQFRVMADTFKLESAIMLKNIGLEGKGRHIVQLEHCHIFHSFDSSGKKLDRCNHVGGHTHIVEISTDSDGNIVTKCSPPIQNPGSEKIVGPIQSANSDKIIPGDTHTHKIQYLKSEIVESRRVNPEAQKYISQFYTPKLNSEGANYISDVER